MTNSPRSQVLDKLRQKPVLRVPELAELLGKSEQRVYALIADGRIPGIIRLGRSVLISRAAIDRWLAGQ